jgi:type IV secretory pathway VirB4 component
MKQKIKTAIAKREENQSLIGKFEELFPISTYYKQRDFTNYKTGLSFNGSFIRTFILEGLPAVTSQSEVTRVLSELGVQKYSIKMLSLPENLVLLRKKLTFARSVYESLASLTGFMLKKSSIQIRKKVADLNDFEHAVYDENGIMRMSMVLTIYGESKEELDHIEKAMQAKLFIKKWSFVQPLYDHKKTFLDGLPTYTKEPFGGRIYTSLQLAALTVGTSTPNGNGVGIDYRGHLLGFRPNSKHPYFFPYFKNDRVYNITVTGKNGSGKSSLMKKLFEELNLYSIQRIVIDPEGEYKKVGEFIGARVVDLNRVQGINPMYFNEEVVNAMSTEDKALFNVKNDHILNLVSFFTIFPFVPEQYKSNTQLVLKSLTVFYSQALPQERYLEAYLDFLMANKEEFTFASSFENFRPMMPYGGFFNSREPLTMQEEAIVFSLKGVEDPHTKLGMMYIIMTQVKDKMLLNNILPPLDAKVVTTFVDEFHLFLREPAIRDRFVEISKRNRKYNCNFILSTQEIHDFKRYGAESLIEQAGYNFVYRQDERCQELLRLNSQELNTLTRMPIGACYVIDPNSTSGEIVGLNVTLKRHQYDYVQKENSVLG